MSDIAKRFLIVSTLLLITAIITFGAYSTKSYSGILYTKDIPLIVGNWFGSDLKIDERTYEILETRDLIMRKYINANSDSVILAVIFSQNNRKIAHPPEVCFTGAGWVKTDRGSEKIIIEGYEFVMNRLILQKDTYTQIALYLYKSGKRLTPNYFFQQINIILNGALHKDTSNALIRISVLSSESNIEKSIILAKEFAKEIIPILEKKLP
jgi:EpsI family protein